MSGVDFLLARLFDVFTPITSRHQVPDVGQGFESPVLDLKEHPDAYKPYRNGNRVWNDFEIAKDVAAFANSIGGTILIGATQDATTGTCSAHTPFAPALATDFESVLRNALKNRCGPIPMVQLEVIPCGTDVMLAVNIWAFPGQVVAVEVTADNKRDWYGDQAYVFPIRMLSHTNYLSAEQTPMLLSPDVRRHAIMLSTLKQGDTIVVHPKTIVESDQNTRAFDVKFVGVDEMKNVLLVQMVPSTKVGVPLDAVSVWYEGATCHVLCDRRLLILR